MKTEEGNDEQMRRHGNALGSADEENGITDTKIPQNFIRSCIDAISER
jgi:hypothetical protein